MFLNLIKHNIFEKHYIIEINIKNNFLPLMLDKLKLKYSRKPLKGEKYNLRNLKAVLDEILLDYMIRVLNLKMNNLYTDFQITVGVLSTILSCIVVYMSMNYEFVEYKMYLVFCLSVYFILNGIVYLCDMLRSTTYKFSDMDVCTDVTPPNHIYTVLVYKNKKLIPEKWSKSVFDLFDSNGVLRSSEVLDELDVFFNK